MPSQVLTDGGHLYYSTAGAGATIIAPSIAAAITYERATGPELKRDHRFIFIEARGTARSGPPPAAPSLAGIVDDLEDLRRQLGLGKVAVWGHSVHSYIAATYAQRHPDALEHIAIIGTPVWIDGVRISGESYWDEHAAAMRRQVAERNQSLIESEQVDPQTAEGFVRAYVLASYRNFYDPTFDSTAWWDPSLVSVPFITAIFDECAGFDLRQALTETTVPVFLAYGKYDFTAPPANWLVDTGAPGLHVELFESSGHYPHVEEEQEFARRYRAWAAQIAASGSSSIHSR